MELFWAIIVSIILLMIMYGFISSKIEARKPVAIGDLALTKLSGVFDPAKLYTVVINSGTKFEKVKFSGFAQTSDSATAVGLINRHWLVLEGVDGKKVFISPYRILLVKEA